MTLLFSPTIRKFYIPPSEDRKTHILVKENKMNTTTQTVVGVVLVGTGTLVAMAGKKLLAQVIKTVL